MDSVIPNNASQLAKPISFFYLILVLLKVKCSVIVLSLKFLGVSNDKRNFLVQIKIFLI